MENDLTCPLCEKQYQNSNPPRLLINCGHTFCQKCLMKLIIGQKGSYKLICPEDGQKIDLKDNNLNTFPKNIALVKILQAKKNNVQFKDLEVSKIVKSQQPQEDEDTRDLVASIISPNNTTSEENIKIENKAEKQQKQPNKQKEDKPKQEAKSQIQLCSAHNKPLQVVCVIDLKKICANCAIFGEHRGHEFKSIQQIQKQRVEYYHAILNIMDKKQSISERISNEHTCNSIMDILTKKKQAMKKSISEKYQKLLSTIENKQKQSMKNLDSVILKTESKLKGLMKIDSNVLQKYDSWEEKSYKEIKILEGENFQSILQLLFVGATNQADVLEEGDTIIQQMYKQEENLINQVQQALENIGVDFNMEIFNHIDNFVELYDEKKKRNKARIAKTETPNPNVSTATVPSVNIHKSVTVSLPLKKVQQVPPIIPVIQSNDIEELTVPEKPIRPPSTIQESLLEMQEEIYVKKMQQPKFEEILPSSLKKSTQKIQIAEEDVRLNLSSISNASSKKDEKNGKSNKQIGSTKSAALTERSLKDSSFLKEKIAKPNKKKLVKIKVPEKYQKVLQGLANDELQLVDFTNAELGDATIIQVCEYLRGAKAKTVKLIRNKMNDESIAKIIPHMKGVITLNLSQNLLTEKTLEIIYDMRQHVPNLKNLILSQNKIVERKHKAKIEKIKTLNINISV